MCLPACLSDAFCLSVSLQLCLCVYARSISSGFHSSDSCLYCCRRFVSLALYFSFTQSLHFSGPLPVSAFVLLESPDEVLTARAPARGDDYAAKMEARLTASKEYLPVVLAAFAASKVVNVVRIDGPQTALQVLQAIEDGLKAVPAAAATAAGGGGSQPESESESQPEAEDGGVNMRLANSCHNQWTLLCPDR